MKNNIIGLMGGMGPYASAYFYKLLLKKSNKRFNATDNNDYPEIVIDSVPVPDFISNTKQLDEAKEMLISRTNKLHAFGCTNIAMVCNTGHILYPEIKNQTGITLVSLINLAKQRVQQLNMKRVGLLATDVTIEKKIYHNEFNGTGIEIVIPDKKYQKMQEEVIRHVISHGETDRFEEMLAKETKTFIEQKHLDGVILGCTELPLVFCHSDGANVIDCLDILADYLLDNYYSNPPSQSK